jgi:hypothetical protein
MIEVKNLEVVLEKINRKKKAVIAAIRKGLREGLYKYEDYIVSNMLSGRKAPNYGLRRVSGIAAGSLKVKLKQGVVNNTVIGNLTVARRAWYLKIHEKGEYIKPHSRTSKKGKTYQVKSYYVRKRIYMYEKFKTKGRQFIDNRITINLQRLR